MTKTALGKKRKPKPQQKMKGMDEDPCPTCMYQGGGVKRNQHNVPQRVEKFNKVKPSEAFGSGVKKRKNTKTSDKK